MFQTKTTDMSYFYDFEFVKQEKLNEFSKNNPSHYIQIQVFPEYSNNLYTKLAQKGVFFKFTYTDTLLFYNKTSQMKKFWFLIGQKLRNSSCCPKVIRTNCLFLINGAEAEVLPRGSRPCSWSWSRAEAAAWLHEA